MHPGRSPIVIVFLALASVALAMEPASWSMPSKRLRPLPPAPEALSSVCLLRSHAGSFSIWIDGRTGLVGSLTGGKIAGQGSTPAAVATSFLARYGSMFKAGTSAEDLKPVETVASPAGHHVRFVQMAGGYRVLGGRAVVHLDRDMAVRAVTSSCKPTARPGGPPRLTAEKAIEAATRALGPKSSLRAQAGAELRVLPGLLGTLVWRVDLPTKTPMCDWEVLVDAQDGAVLAKLDVLKRVDGKGRVFAPNPVVTLANPALRDQNGSASAVPPEAYKEVVLRDLDGSGALRGPYVDVTSANAGPASEPTGVFCYDRSDERFDQVMAYYHIDRAQRRIRSLGFSNVLDRPQAVVCHVDDQDNSRYSPMTRELLFGTGGVDDTEDSDVILHEYGHAILDAQVPDFGRSDEAGAIGEAFGDYWAASLRSDQRFHPELVAMWDATAYPTGDLPFLRRLDSPAHYPDGMAGEVHKDGQVYSACLRQLWNALGADATDRLVLQSHVYLHPESSFGDGAAALMQADRQLNDGAHVAQIKKVFVDRGIVKITGTLALKVSDPEGNAVGARVEVAGQPTEFRTTSDGGTLEAALPPGQHRLTIRAFGFVDASGLAVTIEEDKTSELVVRLTRSHLVTLRGKVTREDTGEALPAKVTLRDTPIAPVVVAGDGSFELAAPAGRYVLAVTSFGFEPFVKTDLDLGADVSLPVALHPLPAAVVVANDDGRGWASFYRASLEAAGVTHDVWDVKTQGAISEESLLGYSMVVWFSGQCGVDTISAADQALLSRYLETGGRLLASGQEIAFELHRQPFLRDVFGVTFVNDCARTRAVEGGGFAFSLEGGDGAGNQTFPDVIALPEGTGGVQPFLSYAGGNGLAGVKVSRGQGRAVFLSFGFEGIDTKAHRDALMADIVQFLRPTSTQIVGRIEQFEKLSVAAGNGTPEAKRFSRYATTYPKVVAEWVENLPGSEQQAVRKFVGGRGPAYRPVQKVLDATRSR